MAAASQAGAVQLPSSAYDRADIYMADLNYAHFSDTSITYYHEPNMAMWVLWPEEEGDNTVYIRNLSTVTNEWVALEMRDGYLWLPQEQLIGTDGDTEFYLKTGKIYPSQTRYEAVDGLKFNIGEDGKTLTMDTSGESGCFLSVTTQNQDGGIYQAYANIVLTPFDKHPSIPPADAQFSHWDYSCSNGQSQFTNQIWMAEKGDDVWIQGLEWTMTNAYVKGKKQDDGSIVIEDGQFIQIQGNFPMYLFCMEQSRDSQGTHINPVDHIVLEWDEAHESYAINKLQLLYIGSDLSLTYALYSLKYNLLNTPDGTPSAPTNVAWDKDTHELCFDLTEESVEGELLPDELLYFSVLLDGEPWTFTTKNAPMVDDSIYVPWGWSFPFVASSTGTFGQQNDGSYRVAIPMPEDVSEVSVVANYFYGYYPRVSEPATVRLKETAVDEITGTEAVPVRYYSPDGMQHSAPVGGINIVVMSDGSTRKMILK